MYILDSDALITPHRTFYKVTLVPEFWDWLEYQIDSGNVKTPKIVCDEIKPSNKSNADYLSRFIYDRKPKITMDAKSSDLKSNMAIVAEAYRKKVPKNKATSLYFLKHDKDMQIIAHVLTGDINNDTLVTFDRVMNEVATGLGIKVSTFFQFLEALSFTTDWNEKS